MLEHRLKPLTPLGHVKPITSAYGPITITEIVDVALASLAIRRDQTEAFTRAATTIGIPLPQPGNYTVDQPFSAFWLGPEQWMVEAPFASHEDIVAVLRPAFGATASITEQTDAWVRFDVVGRDLPTMFERLCAFDLRRHGSGTSTRTMIEHLGCYIVVHSEDRISVIGPRSSAHSIDHALLSAAKSAF